ncbi:MAG: hypothetical protein EA397_07540 [Deltaproteobacteria bacterium]|nr:MAG: hypothetical protein EA397_07540 [Deltaproteobacteria bacterium]
MSIMEKMRGSTDSTPMQIVLILIVVAFIGWYALPQGEQVRVALEVDGQRILMSEYGPRYDQTKAIYQSRDQNLSDADERRIAHEVKQRIASDVVFAREAKRLGFQVGPNELKYAIVNDPIYQDKKGRFNEQLRNDAIKDSGRSKSDFEQVLRREILRDKLRAAVTLGVTLDESAVRAEFEETASTMKLEYVRIEPSQVEQALAPDPQTLLTWADEHDDTLRQAYDRLLPSRFDKPEQVTLRVIRLQKGVTEESDALQERLESIRQELLAGADFGTLARRWSEDPGTVREGGRMGARRVSALTTAVRELLEGVAVGELTQVLDEPDRLSIFKVEDRQEATVVPFAEARESLAAEVYLNTQTEARARAIAEGWTELPPVDLLVEIGAQLQTLDQVSASEYVPRPADPPATLVQSAADAELGAVLEPVSSEGDRPVWFVGRLVERHEPEEDLFKAFRAQELAKKRRQVLDRFADDLQAKARIDTGEGEVTQGGWQDWLAGVLPSSE